jgi:mannose-6-phosphate isomerase-like protein (cupin superfamily)
LATVSDRASSLVAVAKADWVENVERVEKPWGHEIHFAVVDGKYCGKALHVLAGHALSLQYHERKEETVSVQTGRLLFEIGGADGELESFELLAGESIHLRPGTRHRMTAIVDTVVLEASTTELDDVVRLDDRYGR